MNQLNNSFAGRGADNTPQPVPNVAKELAIAAVVGSSWRDFRQAWGRLVVFEVLLKLAEAWLLVPAGAMVLSAVLARAGKVAVSNRDILDFLLTPLGLFYAVLFAIVAVALRLVERAGIMVLAAQGKTARRGSVTQNLSAMFLKTLRIAQLGTVKAVLLATTFVPFAMLAGLIYWLLLTRHDIYFYWKDRPPVFWLAVGVGLLLLLAALSAGLRLYVRWSLALPILLFERRYSRDALWSSRERVRGTGWNIAAILLGWQLAAILIGAAATGLLRFVAAILLERAGERPIALILLLLVVQGGILATLSLVTAVGEALFTRRIYLLRSQALGLLDPRESKDDSVSEQRESPRIGRWVYLALASAMLSPLIVWLDLPRQLAKPTVLKVTAHRGHARAAPENTLSAVRKAIESGADYAEIDVQQTADGVVVLLHDRDLMRVAGDSRRIADLSYEEVRQLDVGSWFDSAFAGERVPTLAEVIDLARGRIRLNIELKFYGPDRKLAPAVADVVQQHDFAAECLVTSFNADAIQEVRRRNPQQRVGLIVAHALGDASRLEVDALSVRADHLSDRLLRAAQQRDLEVHVWTVNDPRHMAQLMSRGVDNLITSDPDLAIRERDAWNRLTGSERLVLASRLLLGLNP